MLLLAYGRYISGNAPCQNPMTLLQQVQMSGKDKFPAITTQNPPSDRWDKTPHTIAFRKKQGSRRCWIVF